MDKENFEIKKDDLKQEQLKELEKKVWQLKKINTFNEKDWNFYFNWEKIKKEEFEIIKGIYEDLLKQKKQVQDNPNIPKTDKWKEYVIINLSSYSINTLLGLYDQVDADFKQKIESNILSRIEKNNFKENKSFLEILKAKDTINIDIYEKAIFNVLKNLSSKEQADELIFLVWKKKIQQTIKNQIIIDDEFAEDFYFNYKSSDKTRGYSIHCDWKNQDQVACNAFSSYLFAMNKQNKVKNLNVLWLTLYKAFNEDLTEFKTWVLESINKYKEFKWNFPDTTHKTFQQTWIIWVINEFIDWSLDKTNMTDSQKQWWKKILWVWFWIWAIYAIFKFFQKTWWKWLLWLIWWWFAAEFWAQATTWEWLLSILDKILNGWFDKISDKVKKSSQKWIDFAKYNKSYKELMWNTTFVNIILWDKKIKDIDGLGEKNWKLIFDAKKYIDSLSDDDWRKQVLKNMWEKEVSWLFITWLTAIWIDKTKLSSDNTVNYFFENNLKQKEEQIQNKNNTEDKSQNTKTKTVWKAEWNLAKNNQNTNNNQDKLDISGLTLPSWVTYDEKNEVFMYKWKTREISHLKKLPKEAIENNLENWKNTIDASFKTWVETVKTQKVFWYLQDAKMFIVWEDWKKQIFSMNMLTTNNKELLKKYHKTMKKANNLQLILTALANKWKDIDIKNKLDELLNNFNIEKLEDYIKKQYKLIDDWKLNKKNVDLTDKLEVLKYIRNEIGDYNLVLQELSKELFSQIEIKNLENQIKEPSNEYEDIKNLLWEKNYKKFQIDISDKKSEWEKYWIENKDKILSKYPSLNKEQKKQIKDQLINTFALWYAKQTILEKYIEKNSNILENDTKWELFSDITWVWWAWYNFSDKTLDWWKETFVILWTEIAAIIAWAVSMWAWFYAVNTALWGTRWYKGLRYVQKLASSSSKTMKVWRWTWGTIVEWLSFYAWYGAFQSAVEWENMYSWEWLWYSIAFIWAFRWLNALYSKIPWLKLDYTKPLKEQKLTLWKQIVIDSTVFSWLGLWFEWVLLEPGNWSAETIVQAIAMAILFKGTWIAWEKFKLRNNDWKVEVYTNIKWREIEYKLWKDGKVETAIYKDTWENVSKQQLVALNKKLEKDWKTKQPETKKASETEKTSEIKSSTQEKSAEKIVDDIKSKKINPEKLSSKEKSKLLTKLLWLWWKAFNREFKDIFSWNKKELPAKLIKFVFTWNPNIKAENYNFFKSWNIWKWLWNIALTWGFASLTWGWALKDYYDSWSKINTDTWNVEFIFDKATLDNIDWEDIALNYVWYGILNRFIMLIYAFDDIAWKELGLYKTELTEFLKIMPPEWVEKASLLPWIWDNLKNFLERWFQDYEILYKSE